MSELSEALAQERLKRGLSQGDMTRALEISKGHLSRIESGKVLPSSALLERWAHELGLSPRQTARYRRALDAQKMSTTITRLADVAAEAERHASRVDELAHRLTALEAEVLRLERHLDSRRVP